MSFDIGMFDSFDVGGLFAADTSPLADIDISTDELTGLNETFTKGLGEKFDDGFLSSDDIDGQLEKFWENEKFSGVSADDKTKINSQIKDQIWEKAGAENITTGSDIQTKEYEQRLEDIGKEFEDKEQLTVSELDKELQKEMEDLGLKADENGVITKEQFNKFKKDINSKLAEAKEKGFGDLDGDGKIDDNELKVLDVNQDDKIDDKDGDFHTSGEGEKGVINEKDKAADARTKNAKEANDTTAGADKNKKQDIMKKIMTVLNEVVKMMQAQAKQRQQQAQQQPPQPVNNNAELVAAKNAQVWAGNHAREAWMKNTQLKQQLYTQQLYS